MFGMTHGELRYIFIVMGSSECSLLDEGRDMFLTIAKDTAGTPYLDVCSRFVAGFAFLTDHAAANMRYFSVHENRFSSSILTIQAVLFL